MKRIILTMAGAMSAFVLVFTAISPSASAQTQTSTPTIVGTAVAVNAKTGEFSTLIAALKCTGLVKVLDSKYLKFTVFAPTDAAFKNAGVNKDTVCSAFTKRQLSNILLYHVNLGEKDSSTVLARRALLMANFQVARISGGTIAGQNIVDTDIRTSNGIIHIVDGVLLPPRL
jgi:uncharacterized surface protein with fasciclin (FAS1) repeats